MRGDFIVVSDFDGTITTQDTLDIIVDEKRGKEYRERMDKKIFDGEISNREYLESTFGEINITMKEVENIMNDKRDIIDDNFLKYLQMLKSKNINLVILSSGMKQIIDILLPDIPASVDIYCNSFVTDGEPEERIIGAAVSVSKIDIIKNIRKTTDKKIIYIGDGVSDIGVCKHVDKLYTIKGKHLEKYCTINNIKHESISSFSYLVDNFAMVPFKDERTYVKYRVEQYENLKNSYSMNFPTIFDKGIGCELISKSGKRYIDCINGFGVNLLEHNHPVIVEKAKEFFDMKLPAQVLDFATEHRYNFIDTILSMLPMKLEHQYKIQFSGGSGSDAVESAIELARSFTKRNIVVAFSGSFHGTTQGAMNLTGNEKNKVGPHVNTIHMPYPNDHHCPFGIGGEAGVTAIVNYIENTLDDPKRGFSKPAAFIMEVVQSDGGIIIAPNRFVREIRRITMERNILLIIDEVQTGMGKTGLPFGFMHSNIVPDIITCSKSIGGSMPLSCVIYKKNMAITHRGTFRGNHLAMYLGHHVMQYVKNNGLVQNAATMEKYITKRLQDLKNKYAIVGDVRCKGVLFAIEINHPDTNGYYPEMARKIFDSCFHNGLICKLGGRHYSSLLMWGTLAITEHTVDNIFCILDKSVQRAIAM